MKAKNSPLQLMDARILGPVVNFLDDHGANVSRYLDRQRIPIETILKGGWITKKQMYRLVHDVVQGERCHELIFASYDCFQLDDLGPIAVAINSCRTVKEALEVTTRLGSSAYEGNDYYLRIEGPTTWLAYREPKLVSDGQDWINDMTLSVYRRLITLLADPDWRPRQILTQGPGFDRHLKMDNFADCEVRELAGEAAIAFPTEFLSRKLNVDAGVFDIARCDDWIQGCETDVPFVDALHRLVATRFCYRQLPTLYEVASMSGISSATIKRHMALAGITYQALLDRIRFDEAEKLLSENELSIEEIARELGYSGSNNFIRAFRRMTAMTPAMYRRRHLER